MRLAARYHYFQRKSSLFFRQLRDSFAVLTFDVVARFVYYAESKSEDRQVFNSTGYDGGGIPTPVRATKGANFGRKHTRVCSTCDLDDVYISDDGRCVHCGSRVILPDTKVRCEEARFYVTGDADMASSLPLHVHMSPTTAVRLPLAQAGNDKLLLKQEMGPRLRGTRLNDKTYIISPVASWDSEQWANS